MTVPVVFIIFNRPDTTRRVFDAIRRFRPDRLLVIADGPRAGRAGEAERCAATRKIIAEGVDWPCQVERCWSDINLGCKARISSGLTWAFSRAEAAIVLEDDCLPDPSFFLFCETLLAYYADDERVGSIGGCNFLGERRPAVDSYRFSRFSHIWGWATWARAWKHYDVTMKEWGALRSADWLLGECASRREADFWRSMFDAVASGRLDTWDFQWVFSSWANRMSSVVPAVNLISNIGFGADATHTTGASPLADRKTFAIETDLRHPSIMAIDHVADRVVSAQQYRRSWRQRCLAPWFASRSTP